MSAQDIIMGSRVAHVRELKAEIERLKSENAALRDERDALKAHFDLALLAATDLRDGEPLEIWDGWNLILGAKKEARDRADLIARAEASGKRVWIVFDGPDERVAATGRVRVSYTGGTGAHRADRLIVDFVRAAAYLGLAEKVSVRTNDKDFQKAVRRTMNHVLHVRRDEFRGDSPPLNQDAAAADCWFLQAVGETPVSALKKIEKATADL